MSAIPADHTLIDDATALSRYSATGDPRAFEVLVHRYQAMVLATCVRALRNENDAEDAAQEAFLRLAQHAGRVRSNAAAWLHACAMNASVDLLRRRGAAARAERRAAREGGAAEGADRAALWSEIEPLLDEAIASLDESDRELIVGRFLAGRSHAEMAAEAGVNPGTVHRRIDRALDRLRDRLGRSGLSAGAGLGAVLALGAAGVEVSPALTGAFVKTGLACLARGARSTPGLGGRAALAATLVVAGLATIGGLATLAPTGGAGGGPPAVSAGVGGVGIDRPRSATKPMRMVSQFFGEEPGGLVRCEGDRIFFEDSRDVIGRGADGRASVSFTILASRPEEGADRLTLRVDSSTMPEESPFTTLVGKSVEVLCRVSGDRVSMEVQDPSGGASGESMTWLGVRPPAWHPAAGETGLTSPVAPALAGVWFEIEEFDLVLSKDDITVRWGDWTVHRFRILEWERAEKWTRVRAICADSLHPSLVGDRVRLLIREDTGGGLTIAMHEPDSDRLDSWPEGFDAVEGVRLMSFRRVKP